MHNYKVSELTKTMVKIESLKIPILKIIDLDKCLETYLILGSKKDKKVIKDDQYAYKVYPFHCLLTDDKRQMEFANECQVLTRINDSNSQNIIKLSATLLGKDHVAFRLPLYEMTLRDFICDHR